MRAEAMKPKIFVVARDGEPYTHDYKFEEAVCLYFRLDYRFNRQPGDSSPRRYTTVRLSIDGALYLDHLRLAENEIMEFDHPLYLRAGQVLRMESSEPVSLRFGPRSHPID